MRNLDLTLREDMNKDIFKIIDLFFPIVLENQSDSSSIYIKVEINEFDMNMIIRRHAYFDIIKEGIASIKANKKYNSSDLKELVDYIIRYNEFAPYNSSDPMELNNIDGINTLVITKNHWGFNKNNNTSFDGIAVLEIKFQNKELKDTYLKDLLTNRGEFYVNSTGYIDKMIHSKEFNNMKEHIFNHMNKEQMLQYLESLNEEELLNVLMDMKNENFFINYYCKDGEIPKQYKKCKQKD